MSSAQLDLLFEQLSEQQQESPDDQDDDASSPSLLN